MFITQSYFSIPKDIILNETHYLKVDNKKELQNITISYSADINYIDFVKIHRKCTKQP